MLRIPYLGRNLHRVLNFLIFVSFFLQPTAAAEVVTLSLVDDPGLSQQRDCVQKCLDGGGYDGDTLWYELGCTNDSCFCREDLRPSASSIVKSCLVTKWLSCTQSADYSAAISIYDRYCSFTAPAVISAEATSTSVGEKTIYTSAPTATVTIVSSSASSDLRENEQPTDIGSTPSSLTTPISTPTSRTSSTTVSGAGNEETKKSDDGGLSKSDKIQIIVGTVVPVTCLAISGIVGFCYRQRRKNNRQDAQVEENKIR
ncbi:hypothetical protein BDV96DRAFT_644545 [Lophiotrema nucula]|uniref:Extracellular membrane protein CFEM domain-containing protein n=1 Tax=Lophiotrema nucula TaxID=690887 RepID=A0A6A5ZFB0_9PLEO|nr:hypothetical protein BDV96DRAFT_644545 [Lophiotrema nucula]